MGIITVHYTNLLILLVLICLRTCLGASTFSCREDERNALLQFKGGISHSHELLNSWSGRDCCSWSGVACNNRTNHVTRLDLRIDLSMGTTWVEGREINPCLLALPELRYLDLSGIHFHGAHIPKFIGSFKRLGYLNLSNTYIAGRVPPELGNLSGLHHLDLSMNSGQLKIEDVSWLSHLSSLEYLDLSEVEIKNASHALHSLGTSPVLSELRLAASLTSIPSKLHRLSFTSLRVLDISANECNTTLPEWPFEIGSLKNLNLSGNHFSGLVPNSMGDLTSLKVLDLSNNRLERDSLYRATSKLSNLTTLKLSSMELKGQFPIWLGDLKNLKYLHLSSNQLNGTLPASLGHLSRLVELNLSNNSFDGIVIETHFRDLVNLKRLDLSGNSLTIGIKPEWNQPWHLDELALDDCKVGPDFPSWLRKMENISSIQMFNVGISDAVPDWFWNFSLNVYYINMSKNMIEGRLPTSLSHLNYLAILDMSNNQLEGQIPQLPTKLEVLHLSNNLISGSIPRDIGEISSITYLDVSANKLSGSIPSSICKLEDL